MIEKHKCQRRNPKYIEKIPKPTKYISNPLLLYQVVNIWSNLHQVDFTVLG